MTAPAHPQPPETEPTQPTGQRLRWLIGGAAAAAAVAGLVGALVVVANETAPPEKPSYVRTATPADEEMFLLTVRVAGVAVPPGDSSARVEWVGLGHDMCRALTDGVTYQQVLQAGASGFPVEQRRKIVTSAVSNLCPQHSRLLPTGSRAG